MNKLEEPGVPEGSRKSLKEIKEAAATNPEYQNMLTEAQDEAHTELQAFRNLKATAARTSNTSAAKDVTSTMSIHECEVCVLQ
jgi:hypothetical protein